MYTHGHTHRRRNTQSETQKEKTWKFTAAHKFSLNFENLRQNRIIVDDLFTDFLSDLCMYVGYQGAEEEPGGDFCYQCTYLRQVNGLRGLYLVSSCCCCCFYSAFTSFFILFTPAAYCYCCSVSFLLFYLPVFCIINICCIRSFSKQKY